MSTPQSFHCRMLADVGSIRTSHASSSHQCARLLSAAKCVPSECSRANGLGHRLRRQPRFLTGKMTHGQHTGLKAEPDGKESAASPETSTPADAEARLEALERGAKRKKGTDHISKRHCCSLKLLRIPLRDDVLLHALRSSDLL